MKMVPNLFRIIAIALLATAAWGQKRPDFSGEWKATPAPPVSQGERRGTLGSGWGDEIFIRQDASTLTVEREFFSHYDIQPTLKYRYALDGSKTTNSIMMGRGIQKDTSTASWQGGKLVIRTLHPFVSPEDGKTLRAEVTRTLSLEPASLPAWPPSLVVETKRSGVLGGIPSTTRTVYVRR